MEVVHKDQNPEATVAACFKQPYPCACICSKMNGVSSDPGVRQSLLVFRNPTGLERLIRQDESGRNGYDKSNGPLDNKEPPPSTDSGQLIHLEYADGNQASKSSAADIGREEDGDPCRDFLPSVKGC